MGIIQLSQALLAVEEAELIKKQLKPHKKFKRQAQDIIADIKSMGFEHRLTGIPNTFSFSRGAIGVTFCTHESMEKFIKL